jgi:hypothetical protein
MPNSSKGLSDIIGRIVGAIRFVAGMLDGKP